MSATATKESTPESTEKKADGVLYIGIDLGTSRTSVASSNGLRETVWGYVGYPKDVVSTICKSPTLWRVHCQSQKRLKPFQTRLPQMGRNERSRAASASHDGLEQRPSQSIDSHPDDALDQSPVGPDPECRR